MKKILIMAGGTGGHVFPALATAHYLKKQGHQVFWLGTADHLEAKVAQQEGFLFLPIPVSSLRGQNWRRRLSGPFMLVRAILAARTCLKKVKPDVVLGMGGYAAGPGGLAAWLLKIPLVLHEQNAYPGLTNRYLARFACKVLTAYPIKVGPRWGQVVGNPVRAEIVAAARTEFAPVIQSKDDGDLLQNVVCKDKLKLLVLGGSLGARVLNEVVPQACVAIKNQVEIWHQTGTKTFAIAQKCYQESGILPMRLTPFIEDMATAYAWADIVIARAGALTVSELTVMGKPAIFIPYLYAVDDHQYHNALHLAEAGAAIIIREQALTAQRLTAELQIWLASPLKLACMAEAMRRQGKIAATEAVAQACLAVTSG